MRNSCLQMPYRLFKRVSKNHPHEDLITLNKVKEIVEIK